MTVQELIDELNKIDDKFLKVHFMGRLQLVKITTIIQHNSKIKANIRKSIIDEEINWIEFE